MSMTGLNSMSPLKAAREWRGLSLPVAARTSGLPLTQVEALEDGDSSAFATVEEMVAASVLYTAALGVGRDEAMALLDRAATRGPVDEYPGGGSSQVHPAYGRVTPEHGGSPVAGGGLPEFSAEVQRRSQPTPSTPAQTELTLQPFEAVESDTPVEEPAPTPTVTPDVVSEVVQAAVSLDAGYRLAIEQSTSELEAWAIEQATQRMHGDVTGEIDRIAAPSGPSQLRTQVERLLASLDQGVGALRTSLQRSEHATLIVAIAVGAMLIALLVAISSAMSGGGDAGKIGATKPEAAKAPVTKAVQAAPAPTSANADAGAAGGDTTKATAPKPVTARGSLTIEVLNAGHVKGKASQTADQVKKLGYNLGNVGNTQTRYASSMILAPKNLQREAERLSKDTGITTMDTLPDSSGTPATHMTIIIV